MPRILDAGLFDLERTIGVDVHIADPRPRRDKQVRLLRGPEHCWFGCTRDKAVQRHTPLAPLFDLQVRLRLDGDHGLFAHPQRGRRAYLECDKI